MGMLKDIVQAIIRDPLIPVEKRAEKRKETKVAAYRPVARRGAFCDPSSSKPCVTVCEPSQGCACDCRSLKVALVKELARRQLNIVVSGMKLGCSGACKNGPMLGFPQKGFWYLRVKMEQIPEIVEETLVHGRILHDRLSLSPDRSCRSDVYFEKDTGLLAVIDDQTSMVEIAKYFMEFERGLSCGKCIPCRVGLKRMEEGLERVIAGQGTTADLEQIKSLCQMMKEAAYCDFAMASSRPIFSAVEYFEKEFRSVVSEAPPAPVEERVERVKKKEMVTASAAEPTVAGAEVPIAAEALQVAAEASTVEEAIAVKGTEEALQVESRLEELAEGREGVVAVEVKAVIEPSVEASVEAVSVGEAPADIAGGEKAEETVTGTERPEGVGEVSEGAGVVVEVVGEAVAETAAERAGGAPPVDELPPVEVMPPRVVVEESGTLAGQGIEIAEEKETEIAVEAAVSEEVVSSVAPEMLPVVEEVAEVVEGATGSEAGQEVAIEVVSEAEVAATEVIASGEMVEELPAMVEEAPPMPEEKPAVIVETVQAVGTTAEPIPSKVEAPPGKAKKSTATKGQAAKSQAPKAKAEKAPKGKKKSSSGTKKGKK